MPEASVSNDTRALLVGVATELFASQGFHAVSVAGLCRAAGLANGTFYLYFKNKDEAFAAVVAEAMQELALGLRAPERATLSARERDRFDVEMMVNFIDARHDLFRILVTEHGLRNEQRDSLIDMFAQQRMHELNAGVHSGEYRADLNPEIQAYAEVGLTHEILQRWMRRPSSFTKVQVIDELCRVRRLLLFGA